eukprot:15333181-Ditylum_brightwellii.AAC.1
MKISKTRWNVSQENANEDSEYKNDMDSLEGVNFVDTIEFLDDDEADMEFINDTNEHLFSNDQGYL